MKREELSEVISSIDPKFILEAETYSWKTRRRKHLWRGGAAAAALVCLAVLLHTLLPQKPAGLFTVKAYALDLDEGGAVVLREEDLLAKSDYWGAYCDGENFYINMGLRYEGENIESVTFTTEEGFFAQQWITPGMSEEDVSAIYAGPEKQLVVFGEEFTLCGSSVTLEGSEMEEGLLLFWGIQALSTDDIPRNPQMTAKAVFQDGSTQTIPVTLDLSGTGVYGGNLPRDEQSGMPVAYHQSQYYKNLPLENCELVDEQRVTDRYEYTIDDYTLSIQVPEREVFDENGQYRVRRQRISGAFYLAVFQMEGDTCVARLYRVPEELEYSPENGEQESPQPEENDSASAPESTPPEEAPVVESIPEAESSERQETEPEPPAEEAAGPQQETGSGDFTVRTGVFSEEESRRIREKDEYYEALSLSECELIEEKAVTDKFSYRVGSTGHIIPVPPDQEFDAHGFYHIGWDAYEGGTFLTAIYRDSDGNLWGRIYRVPEELMYPE